ncbi:alkaline phosphatase [Spongiibacter sp. IMCC21906]|uniref:alkaline phosphatase n=1 Tax=Spongiibacter sp. IMCC21906 TaxID=1620392 RepID=UPI00062DD499|nr:alkaline phosphatase [Spongiibacter sp. IMCC21906]AKH69259.1 alkaline phosphatase [Spongiibacter sp. IMCC21906]
MRTPALLALCLFFSACEKAAEPASNTAAPAAIVQNALTNTWYRAGHHSVNNSMMTRANSNHKRGEAKNIILFIGDGMGISTLTAARIFQGQQQGKSGEENSLSFERFPYSGLIKTYNVDAQVPDSAGTMTAIITGAKTDAGVLAVNESVERGHCATQKGTALPSALELAELAGKSTGIISTARITHATPAANYAKSIERNWESDSDIPKAEQDAGCEDIALQLIRFKEHFSQRFPGQKTNGIEVILGGGRRNFLPAQPTLKNDNEPATASNASTLPTGKTATATTGVRSDGNNLIKQWQQQSPTGQYISTRSELLAADLKEKQQLLGLFNPSHMQFEADRKQGDSTEPSLAEMTEKAITLLSQNNKGYFLVVEAGRIDHAHHAGNAYRALSDTVALSDAVETAARLSSSDDTLIIVTADHSHVFTMAGYPKRGNPILGKVVSIGSNKPTLANDGKPYTTLAYSNGPGAHMALLDEQDHTNTESRPDLKSIDTEDPNFIQSSLVPLSSETHGGEDVAIFASGPGAELVSGSHEQNRIFHIMNYAAALTTKAKLPAPPTQ